MRKQLRKPAELGSLDLFRQVDRGGTASLLDNAERMTHFLAEIETGLKTSLSKASTIHGWRTQALFASLLVALDACELLMVVDQGEVFYDGESVKPPDYLVVLRDGRRLLVEVKLVAPSVSIKASSMSAAELTALSRFAGLLEAELYVASLFATSNHWALNRAADFIQVKQRMELPFEAAMKLNEFGILGDMMLGIEPEIRLDLLPDPHEENRKVAEDQYKFTVGAATLSLGGNPTVGEAEWRLGWFLLLHSQWPVDEEFELNGDSVVSKSWIARPEFISNPDEGLELIGPLSRMYTNHFIWQTTGEDGVTALDVDVEPGILPALIPQGFAPKNFRLIRLIQSANRSGIDNVS